MSNAVGGIFDTVGSIFGIKGAGGIFHGADYSGYNEMVAQYDNLLDIWDELLVPEPCFVSYAPIAALIGAVPVDEEMIIFSFELYFRNHTTVDFPYDIGVTSLTINKMCIRDRN